MEIKLLSKIIIEFYEKLSSWEDAAVRDTCLTTAQMHTIEIVGHSGPIKMKDLAEKIGVTTGTLTVAADRLEKKGLLVRKPHAKDRRAVLIELTPEGEKYFEQHYQLHLNMTKKLVEDLNTNEVKQFAEIINKILDKI